MGTIWSEFETKLGSNWDLWRNFAIFRLLIFGIRNLAPEESVENLIRLLPDSKQRRFRSGTSFSFLIKILNMTVKAQNSGTYSCGRTPFIERKNAIIMTVFYHVLNQESIFLKKSTSHT